METRRIVTGAVVLAEAGLAILGVLVHYSLTAEYGDVTRSPLDAMTSGFVMVPLLLVAAVAIPAVLGSTVRWMRWTAMAIPVLMLAAMLVVTPAALSSKLEVQYDTAPQCTSEGLVGPVQEDVVEAQRAFDSIEHVGLFTGGGGEGEGGCFRSFILTEDVDVLQHYRVALPGSGWRVVEENGPRLRAEREGMAFEVTVCAGGGVVWAGMVTDQSQASCELM